MQVGNITIGRQGRLLSKTLIIITFILSLVWYLKCKFIASYKFSTTIFKLLSQTCFWFYEKIISSSISLFSNVLFYNIPHAPKNSSNIFEYMLLI